MRRPSLVVPILLSAACTQAVGSNTATSTSPATIVVGRTLAAPAPASGGVTRTTTYESSRTVAQILRLAPNSRIAEHHHPYYDESFVVTQGRVALTLNGAPYEIGAGEFIVMPAGTVISGRNAGDGEAVVVVTFSSTGTTGPLSVSGSSH